MEINGKAIVYSALLLIVLLLLSVSLGIINLKSDKFAGSPTGEANSKDMPEKCKLPSGQEVNSWKEHLSHHAETKECLKYFN